MRGVAAGAAALLGARGALQEPLIVHHEEHALAVESGRGFAEIIELRAKSRPPDLVAGLRDLTPSQASKWANHVRQGRWMLIENGLGFAAPEQSASQRALLFNAFGLLTGPAIPASQLDAIYVEYRWPVRRMVRHFGAVTPVSGGQVIATIGGIPVACRLSRGPAGGVIYLGTPLGPLLASQDPEARDLAVAFARELNAWHLSDAHRLS